MEKLPFSHTNCHHHNKLAYKLMAKSLAALSDHFRGHVYDLGCGEMPYKDWLLSYADQYTGVDWGSSLHELKADILTDLNKPLPIVGEAADTVISFSVMEHLCEPQVFLGEAHRILKRGGAMILQVPFMWWVHEAPYDYYRYTRYGLEYMFEKAGFADVNVYPQAGFWTMWFLKFNYQSCRLIRGPKPLRMVLRTLLIPAWWLDQTIAPMLDKVWPAEGETKGYFVTARKP